MREEIIKLFVSLGQSKVFKNGLLLLFRSKKDVLFIFKRYIFCEVQKLWCIDLVFS